MYSFCDIPPQNTLLSFSQSVISSVLTPSGALRNVRFFSPFGEYLGHPSGTVWKLKQDLTVQWPIVRKDQLDRNARFIDATLDPSYSLPSTFFDGRHTLHACETQVALNDPALLVSEISVFHKYHTTCLAYALVYVDCKSILMDIPKKVIVV